MLHTLPRPRDLPDWAQTLEDLGRPTNETLAQVLGVTARTVARWNAAGEAPRAALMALWPATRWGRSSLDAQLHNEAALYRALAESRRRQVDALKRRLLQAEAAASGGAANAPSFDPLQVDGPPAWAIRGAGRRPTGV